MKIVHLTDFHYSPKHIAEQNRLIDALIYQLKTLNTIDFVFFTGDLVLKGGNKGKYFDSANNDLLVRIASECNISKEKIFICCGNHDVSRGEEMPAIKTHIDNLKSIEQLDQFVNDSDKRQFGSSLENIQAYIDFQNSYYTTSSSHNYINDLYTIHYREVDGKEIAIATINTAWRSFSSEEDKGNLLFPISILNEVIENVKDKNIKILLMHHSFSDLKEFIGYDMEDLVFNSFDLLFSGHVHKSKISTHISGNEGIFWCVSPATLTIYDNNSTIGFSTVQFSPLELHKVEAQSFIYDKRLQLFKEQSPIQLQIPLGIEKANILKFKSILRDKLDDLISKADELLLSAYDNGNNKKNFLELFTAPVLKNRPKAEYARSKADYSMSKIVIQNYDLDKVTVDKNNYVINGQDKSGKTSLLFKAHIDLLKNFNNLKIVPYYIDAREYKIGKGIQFNWVKLLARYFSISQKLAQSLPEDFHLRLLIDNYLSTDEQFNINLRDLLNSHTNISYVICTEETLHSSYEKIELGIKPYESLFIYDISRSQVRGLTEKWPSIPTEKKEQAVDKILSIFNQLRVPCNYWNVSLFLWIFEKTSNTSLHNNVDLIQLYIEKLLDKENLALDKSIRISFDQLKDYLGELAHYLISEHAETTYSATHTEISIFTSKYKETNIRFIIDDEDVIKLALERGVLKKNSNGLITFRLNGVFEYFLAVYLKNNDNYRNQAIEDNHTYLSFANEFELYAGFSKRDEKFVEKILDKTLDIFESTALHYGDQNQIDEVLISRTENIFNVKIKRLFNLNQDEVTSLSLDEKDELLEEHSPVIQGHVDVFLKKYYDKVEINSENLEKALKILSRVFRNSTLNDLQTSKLFLDYILQCACHLGFVLIDETKESNQKIENIDDASAKKVLRLWVNFIPLIVETFLFDSLAQDDLDRLFRIKLEELKKEPNKNQYLITILYLLLIDLNPAKNQELIIDAIKDINLGMLQNTILVKLYYYLIFETHGKKQFEDYLRARIRELVKKINPATDNASIDKRLSQLSKASLIENAKK